MKTILIVFLASLSLISCHDNSKEHSEVALSESREIIGKWESEHSYLTVTKDNTFKFRVKIDGDKSRGSGIWEAARDGGYYFRYRADKPTDYRSSQAEYFRVEGSGILFLYIDCEERFTKKN